MEIAKRQRQVADSVDAQSQRGGKGGGRRCTVGPVGRAATPRPIVVRDNKAHVDVVESLRLVFGQIARVVVFVVVVVVFSHICACASGNRDVQYSNIGFVVRTVGGRLLDCH